MKENYKIHVKNLNNSSDCIAYKNLLYKEWDNNVYYSIEHLRHFGKESDRLKYFLFEKDNTPIIIMPFIYREIKSETKSVYYDVISPYGYSGPLFNDTVTTTEIEQFWKDVDQWYIVNNVITEFVRFSLNDNYKGYSGDIIKTLSNVKGCLMENFENQWNAFVSKVRNNYRKAVNYDLDFKVFDKKEITKDVISTFNAIYENTMTRNKADSIYFFSYSYFENLILSNIDNFSIVIAYYQKQPISVELIINYRDTLFAFLGGTNAEYFSYRPNDFLRVKIIEWAINNGKKYYVLGGGMKDGDGLYKNKKSLFPKDEDVIFYTGRKVVDKKVYDELCQLSDSNYSTIKEEELNNHFFPFYRINNR